jgi:hypothetical protein
MLAAMFLYQLQISRVLREQIRKNPSTLAGGDRTCSLCRIPRMNGGRVPLNDG